MSFFTEKNGILSLPSVGFYFGNKSIALVHSLIVLHLLQTYKHPKNTPPPKKPQKKPLPLFVKPSIPKKHLFLEPLVHFSFIFCCLSLFKIPIPVSQ